MARMAISGRSGLRIVWAIAVKDVVDAAKNRLILSVIVGAVLVLLTSRAPLLLGRDAPPRLGVLTRGGDATLLRELGRDDTVQVRQVDSHEEMAILLGDRTGRPALGVILPEDLPDTTASGAPLEIASYYIHWMDARALDRAVVAAGEALSRVLARPVTLRTTGHAVYPPPDSAVPALESINSVVLILVMTMFLVPYLLVEERETRTIEALRVSPASSLQIVMGKALAGATYGLCAAAALFAFSARMITHWGVASAAGLAGVALGVSVGLLMGITFENTQSLGLWSGVLAVFLLMPPVVEVLAGASLPPALLTALRWVPSSVLVRAYRAAFWATVPADVWWGLAAVLCASLPLYGGVVRVLARQER